MVALLFGVQQQPNCAATPGQAHQVAGEPIPAYLVPIYQAAARRYHLGRARPGDPRLDQRRRDELRPESRHLERRSDRLDAVRAVDLGQVRRRRRPRRQARSLRPAGRDLRSRELPARLRRAQRLARRDLRLQPCRSGTSTRSSRTPPSTRRRASRPSAARRRAAAAAPTRARPPARWPRCCTRRIASAPRTSPTSGAAATASPPRIRTTPPATTARAPSAASCRRPATRIRPPTRR